MKKRTKTAALLAVLILFLVTACNLPFSNQEPETQVIVIPNSGENQGEASPEDNSQGEEGGGLFQPKKEKEIDPDPVGLQDGLASLDSYRMSMSFKATDDDGSLTEMSENVERSADEATYTKMTTTMYDASEDDESDTSTTEIYAVGTVTCTYSDDEWEYEKVTEQQKELTDIFKNMVDFLPLIDDPQFVGEETMNGILTNHFTFKVNGIGDTSGSVASVNQGDYWLAVDGQYIVKYVLALEVRSGAEGTSGAEVNTLNVTVNITDINTPISISLPAACHE